jgi:hypothetical protein
MSVSRIISQGVGTPLPTGPNRIAIIVVGYLLGFRGFRSHVPSSRVG